MTLLNQQITKLNPKNLRSRDNEIVLQTQLCELVRDTHLYLSALTDPFLLTESDCSAWIRELPKPRPQKSILPTPAPTIAARPPEPIAPPLPPPPKIKAPEQTFSFAQAMSKVAPQMAIIDRAPSDQPAQQVMNRWKTKTQAAPLSILILRESPAEQALLANLAKALTTYFREARLIQAAAIEKEGQWDSFLSPDAGIKHLLLSEQTLHNLPLLLRHYKEVPATGIRTIGEIPLFFLPHPIQKRLLWEQLCRLFS